MQEPFPDVTVLLDAIWTGIGAPLFVGALFSMTVAIIYSIMKAMRSTIGADADKGTPAAPVKPLPQPVPPTPPPAPEPAPWGVQEWIVFGIEYWRAITKPGTCPKCGANMPAIGRTCEYCGHTV